MKELPDNYIDPHVRGPRGQPGASCVGGDSTSEGTAAGAMPARIPYP